MIKIINLLLYLNMIQYKYKHAIKIINIDINK